jgi:hypothetical protein
LGITGPTGPVGITGPGGPVTGGYTGNIGNVGPTGNYIVGAPCDLPWSDDCMVFQFITGGVDDFELGCGGEHQEPDQDGLTGSAMGPTRGVVGKSHSYIVDNYMFVGSNFADGGKGAIYAYTKNIDGVWEYMTMLSPSQGEDCIGWFAIHPKAYEFSNKDVLVAGAAPLDDGGATGDNTGAVYVFKYDYSSDIWTETRIIPDDAQIDAQAVAWIVLALDNENLFFLANHTPTSVYDNYETILYHYKSIDDGVSWTRNRTAFPHYGSYDEISGISGCSNPFRLMGGDINWDSSARVLALGSHWSSANTNCVDDPIPGYGPICYSGWVSIWEEIGGVWTRVFVDGGDNYELGGGVSGQLGMNVCVDGDFVVSGNHPENHADYPQSPPRWDGVVYVWKRDTSGVWSRIQKIQNPEPEMMSSFGHGVGLRNNILTIGALGGRYEESAPIGTCVYNGGKCADWECSDCEIIGGDWYPPPLNCDNYGDNGGPVNTCEDYEGQTKHSNSKVYVYQYNDETKFFEYGGKILDMPVSEDDNGEIGTCLDRGCLAGTSVETNGTDVLIGMPGWISPTNGRVGSILMAYGVDPNRIDFKMFDDSIMGVTGFRGPTGDTAGNYTIRNNTDPLDYEYANIFNYKDGITAYFDTLTVSGNVVGISSDANSVYIVGEIPGNYSSLGNTGELLQLSGMSASGALNTHWDNDNDHLLSRIISHREEYFTNNNILIGNIDPQNPSTAIYPVMPEGSSVPFTRFTFDDNQTCIESGFDLGQHWSSPVNERHEFDKICFGMTSGNVMSEIGSCCFCEEQGMDNDDHPNCIDYTTFNYCESIGGKFNNLPCINRPEGPDCYVSGSCCVNEICVEGSEENCDTFGGFFIENQTCRQVEESGGCPNSCDEHGACCISGFCYSLSEDQCAFENGNFHPYPCSDTENVNCCSEIIPGACCLDEVCYETSSQMCQMMYSEDGSSGVWWGDGSKCAGPHPLTGRYSPYNCIFADGTVGGTLDTNGKCGNGEIPPCNDEGAYSCLGWTLLAGNCTDGNECDCMGWCPPDKEPPGCCPIDGEDYSHCDIGVCSNKNSCVGACCVQNLDATFFCMENLTFNDCDAIKDDELNYLDACWNGCGSVCVPDELVGDSICDDESLRCNHQQSSATIVLADGTCWECCCDQPEFLEPLGACCMFDGTCSVMLEEQCIAVDGFYRGDQTSCGYGLLCEDLDAFGACCEPNGSCYHSTQNGCEDCSECNVNNIYFGDGTRCSDPTTMCGIGACCTSSPGGPCEVTDIVTCCDADGVFLGPDTDCEFGDDTCNNVTYGSCCINYECCLMTESGCETSGGVYHGDNTSCEDNPCGFPDGSCCRKKGIGVNCFKHIILVMDESPSVKTTEYGGPLVGSNQISKSVINVINTFRNETFEYPLDSMSYDRYHGTISVVSFGKFPSPGTIYEGDDWTEAQSVVSDEWENGSNEEEVDDNTNYVEVIQHVNALAEEYYDAGKNVLVILFSDGEETDGDIVDYLSGAASLPTLGIYVSLSVNNLPANALISSTIATETDGLHYYYDSVNEWLTPFASELSCSVKSFGQRGLGARGSCSIPSSPFADNDYCEDSGSQAIQTNCTSYALGGKYPSWSDPTWTNFEDGGMCELCELDPYVHSCCYWDEDCVPVGTGSSLENEDECVNDGGIYKQYQKCNCPGDGRCFDHPTGGFGACCGCDIFTEDPVHCVVATDPVTCEDAGGCWAGWHTWCIEQELCDGKQHGDLVLDGGATCFECQGNVIPECPDPSSCDPPSCDCCCYCFGCECGAICDEGEGGEGGPGEGGEGEGDEGEGEGDEGEGEGDEGEGEGDEGEGEGDGDDGPIDIPRADCGCTRCCCPKPCDDCRCGCGWVIGPQGMACADGCVPIDDCLGCCSNGPQGGDTDE